MRHAVCRLSGYSAVLAILASMLFGGPSLAQRAGDLKIKTPIGSIGIWGTARGRMSRRRVLRAAGC